MSTTTERPLQERNLSDTPSPSTQGDNHGTKSLASQRSRSSKHSSVVSEALLARARAETTKVKLEFARKEAELQKQRAVKEAELQKQRADQEAELFVLGAEREAALAEVQFSVLEEGLQEFRESVKNVDLVLPQKNSKERVEEYLLSCNVINVDSQMQTEVHASPKVIPTCSQQPPEMENCQKGSKVTNNTPNVVLNTPSYVENVNGISDLSNMLLRKELITSGLRKFNDHAFSYRSWKASLKQVTTELKLKPSQEMDMIVRWLGRESAQLVSAVYDIHVDKPMVGLDRMWELLDRKYGSPEAIEQDLQQRIEDFPKLAQKDYEKLEQYGHLLLEIEYAKDNGNFPGLLHLDSARGLHPLVQKLPYNLQEKWLMEGSQYKERFHVTFPPFKVFSKFVRHQAKIRNDPSFIMFRDTKQQDVGRRMVSVKATDVKAFSTPASKDLCPIHGKNHPITECRAFLARPVPERKVALKKYQLCFRCCFPGHAARECKADVKCDSCGSHRHQTILHDEHHSDSPKSSQKAVDTPPSHITSACSKVQGSRCIGGRSCAKIVPVFVRSKRDQSTVVKTYAIIDDQSNKTIATSQLLDKFNVDYGKVSYTLRTCSGEVSAQGRCADEFVVEDLHGTVCLGLPTVTECAYIPDFKDDIPTPEIVQAYDHLKGIEIPEIDCECTATLLIGRDVVEAHHVLDQRIGPPNSPFAQKLKLGWVIIGDVCLQGIHRSPNQPNKISLLRTQVLSTGRPTYLEPCPNEFQLKHLFDNQDDSVSLSIEEKQFVNLMVEKGGLKDGKWTAPLPFKKPRDRLPNNRQQAWKRAQILETSMAKNPIKKEHMLTFMEGVISQGHAEVAPPLQANEECWYLPLFGVYHPRKKDKIRGVFDSSAEFRGHSLNKVLLKGPDLTNDLVGVLMRFRQGPIAVCGDIESMFFCFSVSEEHRNFLRFFWYEDNDFAKPLIEYRMLKHVFGNTPSPAVANYGLRDLTSDAEPDVRDFIHNNFYVDDGLAACEDSNAAVSLMERTRAALKGKAGIRLHKIASNSQEVLDAFESEEVQKDIRNLTLSDGAPTQRSLGVQWNLSDDTFMFQIELAARPYTKRGVLSIINGVFDPLGFLAPVMVQARVLFREMTTHKVDWDDKLPEIFRSIWESWTSELSELQSLSVPRNYPVCVENGVLNVYCDASEVAVAAVAYLIDDRETPSASFVFGKSKLAPKSGHTIPRLELCAAVLGTEIAKVVCRELNIQASTVVFHSDSRIVLGYLNNTTRRFHTYVANRVHRVLGFSKPSQWRYVPTVNNPADFGTRPVSAQSLKDSPWLIGPQKLATHEVEVPVSEFPLLDPEGDEEVRHDTKIQVTKTSLELRGLVSRFEKFSTWNSLVRAFSLLLQVACSSSSRSNNGVCHSRHGCGTTDIELVRRVKTMIVKKVQEQIFREEYECLREGMPLPSNSTIRDLSPILNQDGLICVGGRLRKSSLPVVMKHPVLIPGKSHIAKLLVLHYHNNGHPGRQLTESALRDAGFWITGVKRVISSVIHRCVNCRKLRGKTLLQRMADLPQERLKAGPPFSQVGVDCFGPWEVVTRKTRGGAAQSKRWGMIFSCLTSRAIHIEVLEEMSTSSCINALRRFMAVRGKVETFWSDRGSNFVGVLNDKVFNTYLERNDTEWKLNPPHAPHMGGAWERMVGLFKGILNGILLEAKRKDLTHETLVTFMMEAMAIVNARPLVPLSSDPEDTSFLSPSMLLTQKHGNIEEVLVEDCTRNMYKAQWKRVQILADRFWKQWRLRYLQSLQQRRKWIRKERNVRKGDIVLLRDKDVKRNLWPFGIIESVSSGDDGLVRQVQVRLPATGKIFCRPVHELILLVEAE